MKKVLAVVLALVIVLSMTACGASKDDGLNVWCITPAGSGIYWVNVQKGVEGFCKENGITNYTLTAPSETANVQQKIELCEAAVSSGADILIVRLSDPEAFLDVVERANKKGITVISLQNEPVSGLEAYVPSWTGISPEMLGQSQAAAVEAGVNAGSVAEDATIYYLSPTLTNPTHIAICDSFCATISAKYPNMKVITDETGSGQPATVAAEHVDAYLLSTPEISVMVANGANETAVMAAKVEGIGAYDDLWVVGCDGGEEQAEMLYINSLDTTVLQDTYAVGYAAAKAGFAAHNGETVDFYLPVGCELLFPDGVEQYCKDYGFDMTAWNSYKG